MTVALAHLEESITRPSVYNPQIPVSLEKYYFKMYREEAGASLSFCGRGDRGSKTGADPSR